MGVQLIMMNKKKCEKCYNEITVNNFTRHVNKCDGSGTWKDRQESRKQSNIGRKYYCFFCEKFFNTAQALTGHLHRSHLSIENQKISGEKGNKILREKIKNGEIVLGTPHTEKTKQHLSKRACERLQKNSKYTKNVEYKPGIFLESSYEIKTAEILDLLNIDWIKVRWGFPWDDNGKIRHYVPDFYLPKFKLYLDPKNDYLIIKDKRKIESASRLNGINFIVLSKDQINKDFILSLCSSAEEQRIYTP